MQYYCTHSSNLISSIKTLELGYTPSATLSHLSLVTPLLKLRPSPGLLTPLSLPPGQLHVTHKPYIHSFTPTHDGALVCLATDTAHLQIHETSPRSTNTHRLTLSPADVASQNPHRRLRLSSVSWLHPSSTDKLLLLFDNRNDVWLFDIATCRITRPTAKYPLCLPSRPPCPRRAGEVTCLSENLFACVFDAAKIRVFDVRVGVEPVGTIFSDLRAMRLCAERGMYLYLGGLDAVSLMDSRVMRSGTGESRSVRCFGRGPRLSRCEIGRSSLRGIGGLGWMELMGDAAPGAVVYQMRCGGVGWLDIASANSGEYVPERGEVAEVNPWHVTKRGCKKIMGTKGFVVIAPKIKGGGGVRVVEFRRDGERFTTHMASHERHRMQRAGKTISSATEVIEKMTWGEGPGASHEKDWVCVHAVDGGTERMILGGLRNTVEMLEVNVSKCAEKEEDC